MNTDFRVLLDKEIPWDANKVKVLDDLVRFFYANSSSANVSKCYFYKLTLVGSPS